MSKSQQKEKHTRIIGSIFLVLGSLSLLGSFFAFNLVDFFHNSSWADELNVFDFEFFSVHEPTRLLYFFPAYISIFGLLKLIAGLGIMNYKPWAEKLSIVLGFFMFFNMPLGTAFAVYIFYTFVGLKSGEAENQQDHASQAK